MTSHDTVQLKGPKVTRDFSDLDSPCLIFAKSETTMAGVHPWSFCWLTAPAKFAATLGAQMPMMREQPSAITWCLFGNGQKQGLKIIGYRNGNLFFVLYFFTAVILVPQSVRP